MVVKIAVLDDYLHTAAAAADWASLSQVELVFLDRPILGDAALIAALAEFDVVVAMRERTPFPAHVLRSLPRLRLLVTTGMRNASIDLDAAAAAGIRVAGTGGRPAGTVELGWALIQGLVRNVGADDAFVRGGGWQREMGGNLENRTLGLVGLGRLGGGIAAIARVFGMEVLAWSPHLTAERAAEHGALAVGKRELFERSDIVSLHLVLAESTMGVIGESELRALGPQSSLVNTARALLVDQDALRRSLTEGWIASAALDVYDVEPLPADHWLRQTDRVLLSPHMGYVSVDSYQAFYSGAVEDIRAYLTGWQLRVINSPVESA